MFNEEDEDDGEMPNVDRRVDLCGTNASTDDDDDSDPMAKTAATAMEKVLLCENIMVYKFVGSSTVVGTASVG